MTKIEWNTAPVWANYAAMDQDEEWFWYEAKPEYDEEWGVFLSPEGARHDSFVHSGPEVSDWRESIVQRSASLVNAPSSIH